MITVYKNMLEVSTPYHRDEMEMLNRIKDGKSRRLVEAIRASTDKDERDRLKKQLPAVSWSGVFTKRANSAITEYSHLLCLDFDNVTNVKELKAKLIDLSHCFACWVSPSGTGVKMLVKVNSDDHKGHFLALHQDHPEIDQSGKDISRLCFESYDPEIYINQKAKKYTKVLVKEVKKQVEQVDGLDAYEIVKKWLLKQGHTFSEGSRNVFVTNLALACLRVGIQQDHARMFIYGDFVSGSGFDIDEFDGIISGVYNRYSDSFGNAKIQNEKLTYENKELTREDFQNDEPVKDLITCEDIYHELESDYINGIKLADTTYYPQIDKHFKWLRGQLNVFNGYGNYGKSTFVNQLNMIRAIKSGNKYAIFSPEQSPSKFFYQDLIQMYVGKSIMQGAKNRMTLAEMKNAKEFVNEYFYLIDPKDSPSPNYMVERFFEMAIKHGVDGCVVDPWNQLAHEWDEARDLYLEKTLPKFKNFAKQNNLYMTIIAHPKNPPVGENARRPSVFDLSGGAMWNNKVDNILCYHRPNHHVDKSDDSCIFASDKVRFQQIVGIPGEIKMTYDRSIFRFFIDGFTPFETAKSYEQIEYNDDPF